MIMSFIGYTIFFASEDSFVQNQSTGLVVLICLIAWLYSFIRFLSSDEVEKYEKSSKINRQKSNGVIIGNKSRNELNLDMINRLLKDNFKLNYSIKNNDINFIATRKKFYFKTGTFLHQHILVSSKDSANIKDYSSLYEFGIEYAEKLDASKSSLGTFHSYMIFPCILNKTMNKSTKDYLTSLPDAQWHIFQFPLGYDEREGKIYYFNGKMSFGALLNSEFKNVINKSIIGIVS